MKIDYSAGEKISTLLNVFIVTKIFNILYSNHIYRIIYISVWEEQINLL